jgi:aerobic-type carbon monoxide dehydrogenase small subunit (CoxS/CutS family)
MTQSTPSVQSLQAEIAALHSALAHDQLERMPQMLADHDLHLKTYCQSADVTAARDGLKALHAQQQDLIRMMRQRQCRILELMRASRHSNRAALAYSRNGWL